MPCPASSNSTQQLCKLSRKAGTSGSFGGRAARTLLLLPVAHFRRRAEDENRALAEPDHGSRPAASLCKSSWGVQRRRGRKPRSTALRHVEGRPAAEMESRNTGSRDRSPEFKYRNDGEIRSGDPQFDAELDTVLNLNIAFLKNSRKGVLDVVLEWWQKRRPSNAQVQARINKHGKGTERFHPFTPVAIWFLQSKVGRMTNVQPARHTEGAFETVIEGVDAGQRLRP